MARERERDWYQEIERIRGVRRKEDNWRRR